MNSKPAATKSDLGRTVLTFAASDIHMQMARAAARALREGLPAEMELADLRPAEGAVASAAVAAAQFAVEQAQATAVDSFTALALAALTDPRRAELADTADRAARHLDVARGELATVTRATHDGTAASRQVILEQFHQAIAALAATGGQVSQAQAEAIAKIFPDLALRPVTAGRWAGSCFMRLPLADGSVLRTGPLTWEFPVPIAADSRRVALLLGESGYFPWERLRARARLQEAGLGADQAQVACDSPYRWLHPVLMHKLTGEPLPDNIPADWTQPQFMSWLLAVYRDRPWNEARRIHTYLRYPAQALLRSINELGGVATARDIAAVMVPLTMPKVGTLPTTLAVVGDDGVSRTITQQLRNSQGVPGGPGRTFALHRCAQCGNLVTDIVDCPEVPMRLLCTCGAMPFAEAFGMDPLVRYPANYRMAVPSVPDCEEFMTSQDRSVLYLGSREVELLQSPAFGSGAWVSTAQVSAHVPDMAGNITATLSRLTAKGLVETRTTFDQPSRWAPRLWRRVRTLEEIDYTPASN